MHPQPTRRQALQAGIAAGLALTLPAARACEYFSSNLRITHPWTRASEPDARTAVVCMKFDEVRQDDRLIDVQTPVAEAAELHGAEAGPDMDLLIRSGQELELSEAGLHIRLTGLKFPLEVARSYPLKLVFQRGGVVNATLNVDYARFL
jgi:copper(I)-binding protein